jgi:large subunit ribosomal protein L13
MFVQKTQHLNNESVERNWFVVDASGKVLGRLASEIAKVLRGKNKPVFSPHVDAGDFVVVVNADKVVLTGSKMDKKMYHRHSNHIGGIKSFKAKDMLARTPEYLVMTAVQGMLPKTSLGRKQLTKLKVFAGVKHDHEAQKPQTLEINY